MLQSDALLLLYKFLKKDLLGARRHGWAAADSELSTGHELCCRLVDALEGRLTLLLVSLAGDKVAA